MTAPLPFDFWTLPFANECLLSAKYVAALFSDINEPPFRDVATLFRDVLFPGSQLSNDTVLEYHDFVWTKWQSVLKNATETQAPIECQREMCEASALKIDEGIVGVGILSGMLLQAVLTSFYVTMTMVMYFKRKRSPESFEIRHIQDAKFGDRFLHAFYGTVSDFFLTSIIFDLGLAIGVITHLATKEHARGSPLGFASTTDRVVPAVPGGGQDSGAYLLVASFSLLSMAGVLPTFLSNSRRQWLRACMICSMVWILGSAALVWSAVIAGSHSGLRDDYQRDFCPDEYLPETYHSVSFGSITLGVLLPPIFGASVAFASFICCCGWREMWKRDWVRHTVRGSIVSFSAVCFFLNWATLVLLLVFLSGTSWFMRTSWGVGQGLALAMWMPLLWEIIYMMIVGIDRGSETRLQKEFFVLREGEVEDIPELVPGSILGPRGRSHAGLVEQAQGTSQMQPVPARQMAMSSNMPTSPPEPNLQSEVRMMDRYA